MVWITFDEWQLKRLSTDEMTTRLYWRLYRYGKRLGVPARKEATPYEFAKTLQNQVISLPYKSLAKKAMIDSNKAIERLTKIYVHAQYNPIALANHEKTTILEIWQTLRRQLILARSLFLARKITRIKSSEDVSDNLE